MTGVDAVLFDLDDTVWEYRRSTAELLAGAFEEVGIDSWFTAADYRERIDDHVDDVDDDAELRRRCFADLATERGRDADVGRAVADAYTERRDYRDVRLLPGAREALSALGADYRLAAVTNGPPEGQPVKMEVLALESAFERVIYAGDRLPAKPDPAPFRRALDHLGVGAERAVHVGNSLRNDVAGAIEAGLRSVWIPYDRSATARGREPTYRLDSMAELVDPPWR